MRCPSFLLAAFLAANLASSASAETLYRVTVLESDTYRLSRLETLVDEYVYDAGTDVAECLVTEAQLRELAKKRYDTQQVVLVPGTMPIRTAGAGASSRIESEEQGDKDVRPLAELYAGGFSDSDGDGMDDAWETEHFGDLSHDGSGDVDAFGPESSPGKPVPGPDRVTDLWEYRWGLDPNHCDSDGDNVTDGNEIADLRAGNHDHGPPFLGWPTAERDRDGDCIPDVVEELLLGLNSNRESTDGDKYDDGQEFFGLTEIGRGGMPRAVDSDYLSSSMPNWVDPPGNHWFVAAYPDLKVTLQSDSFTISPRTHIESGEKHITEEENTYSCTRETGSSSSTETFAPLAAPYPTGTDQGASANEPYTHVLNDRREDKAAPINTATGDADDSLNVSIPNGEVPNMVSIPLVAGSEAKDLLCQSYTKTAALGESENSQVEEKGKDWLGLGLAAAGWGLSVAGLVLAAPILAPTALVVGFAGAAVASAALAHEFVDNFSASPQRLQAAQDAVLLVATDDGYELRQYASVNTCTQYPYDEGGHNETAGVKTSSRNYERVVTTTTSRFFKRDEWWEATAQDTHHAADLRFNLKVRNAGTDVCRKITRILVNFYIGNDRHASYSADVLAKVLPITNLFPEEQLEIAAFDPIPLTLDQLRRIDLGEPISLLIERIEYGDDQVFYQDAFAGGVMFKVDDGVGDGQEDLDKYLIPTWGIENYQDVLLRADPVLAFETSKSGHIKAVSVPQFDGQHRIASHSRLPVTQNSQWAILTQTVHDEPPPYRDIVARPESIVRFVYDKDADFDGYTDRVELREGTDADDFSSHPSPDLLAAYVETVDASGTNFTRQMVLENVGNWPAYGIQCQMYSPSSAVHIEDNLVGAGGVLQPGQRVIIGPTLQTDLTGWNGSSEPSAAGIYEGTNDAVYTFAADSSGSVGWTTNLTVSWTGPNATSGSLDVGAGYSSPEAIEVADGISVRLSSGSEGSSFGHINAGETFSVVAKTARDVFRFSTPAPTNFTPPVVVLSYNDQQGNRKQDVELELVQLDGYLDFPEIRMRPKSPAPRINANSLAQYGFGSDNPLCVSLFNGGDPIEDSRLFVEYLTASGLVVQAHSITNDLGRGSTKATVTFNPSAHADNVATGDEVFVLMTLVDHEGNVIDTASHAFLAGVGDEQYDYAGNLQISATAVDLGTNVLGKTPAGVLTFANTGTNVLEFTVASAEPAIQTSLTSGNVTLRPAETAPVIVWADTRALSVGAHSLSLNILSSDSGGPTSIGVDVTVENATTNTFLVEDVHGHPWRKRIILASSYAAGSELSFEHGLGDTELVVPMFVRDGFGRVSGGALLHTNMVNAMAGDGPDILALLSGHEEQAVLTLIAAAGAGESYVAFFAKGLTEASTFSPEHVFTCTVETATQMVESVDIQYAGYGLPVYNFFEKFEYAGNSNLFFETWEPSGEPGPAELAFEESSMSVTMPGGGYYYILTSTQEIPSGHTSAIIDMGATSPFRNLTCRVGGVPIFDVGVGGDYRRRVSLPGTGGPLSIEFRSEARDPTSHTTATYREIMLDVRNTKDLPSSLRLSSRMEVGVDGRLPLLSVPMDGSTVGDFTVPRTELEPHLGAGTFSMAVALRTTSGALDVHELRYLLLHDPIARELSPELPDLVAVEATASPSGKDVSLRMRISNTGATSAEPFTIGVYGEEADASVNLLAVVLVPAGLNAGQTNEYAQVVAVDSVNSLGSLRCVVDPYDAIPESDEDNNTAFCGPVLPDILPASVTYLRDLGGGSVVGYAHPVVDTDMKIVVNVVNQGTSTASNALVRALDAPEGGVVLDESFATVPAGSNALVMLDWHPTVPELYHITVVVDASNTLAEISETDNAATVPILVSVDRVYIDCGATSDQGYATAPGYGHLGGVPRTDWGSGVVSTAVETVRYDLDGGVDYRFDHLDSYYAYQLDVAFHHGNGVTGVYEVALGGTVVPLYSVGLESVPQVTLNADNGFVAYATAYVPTSAIVSNSLHVEVRRADGTGPAYLSEIQIAQGNRIFIDCGQTNGSDLAYSPPGQTFGYLDGFAHNAPGLDAYRRFRYDYDGDVRYVFSDLSPSNSYVLFATLWEGDGVGRVQRVIVDGVVVSDPIDMRDGATHKVAALISAGSIADRRLDVVIERVNGADVQVSAVELHDWTQGILALQDADGDGMPDGYEVANSRTSGAMTPLNVGQEDADEDADGDGMSNLHEYFAGSDPLNAGSVLALVDVSSAHATKRISITWNAKKLKLYQIEYSPTLTPPAWVAVEPRIQALTTGPMTWTDPNPAARRSGFLRVVVLQD